MWGFADFLFYIITTKHLGILDCFGQTKAREDVTLGFEELLWAFSLLLLDISQTEQWIKNIINRSMKVSSPSAQDAELHGT